ncbi:methyltransferase domain-containing protein [Candidatus Bathyarchaeota archaeon]|nr:methyltransferase domain-containing protein [Candidatus Bathyarchaeota archaeon]
MRGGLLEEKMRMREEFIRQVGVEDGGRILDVGTGSGFLAIGFAKKMRSGEVVGIDIWMPFGGGTSMRNAIRNAEIEGVSDKVSFRVADARRIPYPNDYFDRVVASFVIHIIRGWERAVGEMVRVLKPGGVFAVLEPRTGWAGGWRVNQNLKAKLASLGLKNVEIRLFVIYYPRRREVFLVTDKKAGGFKGG